MIDYSALSEPFHRSEVKWRVGSTNKDKTKGSALAYVDARAVMDRLDKVCLPENWQDKYIETPSNRIICELSIFDGYRWITKSDGAGSTTFEGEKGAISDAFKRSAVKFGVGRYLYELPTKWYELKNNKLVSTPDIDNYITYKKDNHTYRYGIALQENLESIVAIKQYIATGEISLASEAYHEMSEESRIALHKSATKGGIFTIEESHVIRSPEFRKAFATNDTKTDS
jgi:hypothetical protein